MRGLLPLLILWAAPVAAAPTYDLTPLSQVAPEFAPLQRALDRNDRAAVADLAVGLAATSTVSDVRTAAWYLQHRACLDNRRRGCRRLPPGPGSAAHDNPFAQPLLHAQARKAIAGRKYATAWALLSAADGAYRETNRLLLTLAERTASDGWSEAFARRLTKLQPTLSRRARCRLLLVMGDKAADRTAQWSAWNQVWKGPCRQLRRAALERLVSIGMTPSPLERVRWLASRRLPRKRRARRRAERESLRAIERAASGVSGLATYGRAVLYARSRKRRDKALKLFDQAASIAQDAAVLAAAQYGAGDLLGKMSRDRDAIGRLEPLLKMQLSTEAMDRARWRLYRLYRAQRRWLDAERMLNELVAGAGEDRNVALWELAWRRFLLNDVGEAHRLLTELRRQIDPRKDDGKQPWIARIDYWLARCLAEQGKKEEARALYVAVAQRNPQTYYGMIAKDRLAVLDPALAAAIAPPVVSADDGPFELRRLRVRRHPLLHGPVLLLRMGLTSQARDMLRGIVGKQLPGDGAHLLAALYNVTGRSRAAYAVLQRHARRASAPNNGSAAVWRMAYATPFREKFVQAADEAGIPRSLLYAVARHESHFSPSARSPAGALGLTQLLPVVASRVAALYGLPKVSRSALLRPTRNLQLGARYLAQITSFLRGNHVLVLAAYNAGPYAVRRWLKRFGDVPTDVFVESIPYRQARNYARGVLATAHAYATLHPDWSEAGRLAAGRRPRVPRELGPFMVPPQPATEAAAAAVKGLAAPRDPR